MDEMKVAKYLETQKIHKLVGYAIRGEKLEGLSPGEKALVGFYSLELLSQSASKDLYEQQQLLTSDLNAKFDDPTYTFEWNFGSKKDLILLLKIDNLYTSIRMMDPYILKYWKIFDENRDAMLQKHNKEALYIIALRSTLKEIVDRMQEHQDKVNDIIKAKFRWTPEQLEEAKLLAGDITIKHMQMYLNQIESALGV